MSKWIVAWAAVLCFAGYVFVYASGRADAPIRSDGFSYYVYLPSWFIFHDPSLAATARDCCGGDFPAYTAIIRWPGTRRWERGEHHTCVPDGRGCRMTACLDGCA